MFFCDPFGRTDPDALFNYGDRVAEHNYIWLHDQEPIYLDTHEPLFRDVLRRNEDLNQWTGPRHAGIIVSERNSDFVDQACAQYGWSPYYYFFHGWAALDWYRGYDRTFLITPPDQRTIRRSFISPNRIVGGAREHRLLLMYHLLQKNIRNAWISFPAVCPAEGIPVTESVKKFESIYPDIVSVFESAQLPWNFPNESGHPMHSCWLSLFDESAESLAFVVTETVFFGRRHHLTEKTFKPICLQMPFVMASSAGSLEYLRSYGFQTFGSIWDESYDEETDDHKRLSRIAQVLRDLDQATERELAQIHRHVRPMVQHNYQHFYSGAFEAVLWQELQQMLKIIKQSWR
jgi:hypothetical protein